MDSTYFVIFDKLLEDIIFIPDICKIVKLSIYPRISVWFQELAPNKFFKKHKILLLFGLLLDSHPKMNLHNVYEVAIRNNLLSDARTTKSLLDGIETQRYHNDLSCKEHQIMRIVLNEMIRLEICRVLHQLNTWLLQEGSYTVSLQNWSIENKKDTEVLA